MNMLQTFFDFAMQVTQKCIFYSMSLAESLCAGPLVFILRSYILNFLRVNKH